jgi:hypothetical protein
MGFVEDNVALGLITLPFSYFLPAYICSENCGRPHRSPYCITFGSRYGFTSKPTTNHNTNSVASLLTVVFGLSSYSTLSNSSRYPVLYYIGSYIKSVCLVAQSVLRLATGWRVRGSNPGRSEIFRTCPDRPWGPPSLLYKGYRVFPGSRKRPGRDADPSPLSSAEV